MKSLVSTILSICLVLTLSIDSVGAQSSNIEKDEVKVQKFTENELKKIEQEMEKWSKLIDENKRYELLDKLRNGEVWDSINHEKKMKSLVQPEEKKFEFTEADGSVTAGTMFTYPDGSITITSVSGGTSTCGTGYCNYKGRKVLETDFTQSGEFKANYTTVQDDDDYISKVYDYVIVAGNDSYSDAELSIDTKYESYGDPAYAYLRWQASGYTHYVKLYVGDDIAWSEAEF
ncbi:hypothetical protein [Brevibacillus porteri]|uniref:Uncharacterized protein n=1 Tax=Brevibacillus porteri TaxID=2126350 RepID=A0ABX5FU95_9BACL|nr:hypothetical protein [Brevibacillus porteri]MED2743063.1 hypothetical protein [Brevibacillus porteri]MED2817784.1 hypothetical protein [Brevibacillus porteri]MED2896842.1 hypothetical protein [Brevibacillus porteri]MED4893725.1 hypothetical protein [Brevibacillus porteri]PSK12483.1 hypothetical protein C7R92_07120 [Brevibacillus porteri]